MKLVKELNKLTYTFTNNKEEKILVWITQTQHYPNEKNSLISLWYKHGWIKEKYNKTWRLELFVYNKKNNCFNRYNPQIIPNTNTLNFDYVLPCTFSNLKILLNKCVEMANA